MSRRKEINDELIDAPTLAGIGNQPPYKVPAGYFDLLPELILRKIKNGNPQEEINAISPLLGSISKKMPYSVPEGYFEKLNPEIKANAAVEKTPARVVRMFQPPRRFRMAAAAILVAIIGIAGWLLVKQPSANSYAVKTDTEIQKELQPKVNEISDSELANFVEGNTLITTFYSTSAEDMTEEDVKLMLAEIPDKELEKYLDQNTLKEKYN